VHDREPHAAVVVVVVIVRLRHIGPLLVVRHAGESSSSSSLWGVYMKHEFCAGRQKLKSFNFVIPTDFVSSDTKFVSYVLISMFYVNNHLLLLREVQP
jgi:hypothetical protein